MYLAVPTDGWRGSFQPLTVNHDAINSLKSLTLYIYASTYVKQIPMQGIVRINGIGLCSFDRN